MDGLKYKRVMDFGNLLMKLNKDVPHIGFNDEGKAEALFIETRELIKMHYGIEHGFYKDYTRIRSLKASYTFQLQSLMPVVETIANLAKSEYLQESEEYQNQVISDLEKKKGNKIPWKEFDKLERRHRPKEIPMRAKQVFKSISFVRLETYDLKVIFLIMLAVGLCVIPFFVSALPDWLGYVSSVIVGVISILFTMSRK